MGAVVVTSVPPVALTPGGTFLLQGYVESYPIKVGDDDDPYSPIRLEGYRVNLTSSDVSKGTVAGVATSGTLGVWSATVTGVATGAFAIEIESGGQRASVNFATASPSVDHVVVTPAAHSGAPGGTFQISARPETALGALVPGAVVTWGSSNPAIASVSADSGDDSHTATVSREAAGSATITATCETKTDTCDVTVATPGAYLFRDVFTGGVKSGTQNGIFYKEQVDQGSSVLAVVADASAPAGYALEAAYWTPTATGGASNIESHFGLPDMAEVYVEQRIFVEANYNHHNRAASNNNKMLRLWDQNYSGGNVHCGWSVWPTNNGTGSSYLNPEWSRYGSVGTGNWGQGPYAVCLVPNTEVVIGFYVHVASAYGVADGTIKMWKDGVKIFERTNLALWKANDPAGGNFFRNGFLFGPCNSGYDVNPTRIRDREVIIHSTGPTS